eukprot:CAMPEP_0175092912 /NCGR_PEP_ID=MMETSP0086_2-20121207/2714_1 /TAXON_ID=136419 /ORGANISM="Unknown Unknown, Strain D1" /LENGTH=86 /DNA_ID=CAMNT_0016365803 /DNA_START=90 /DNA_END=350 /DNA_ORIENTATION=-
MREILRIRAETEGITINSDGLEALATIGDSASLRYVVQMLTPASILAATNGKDSVDKDDIEEINSLFMDAKASTKMLAAAGDSYLQ